MRRSELRIDDRVWVVLPYEGGRGWATVRDLGGRRVLVEFDAGSTAHNLSLPEGWGRMVSPRSIVRREEMM